MKQKDFVAVKINLKYHSCLGCFNELNNAKNLLSSNDRPYGSKIGRDLQDESFDWIVFEIVNSQSYCLKHFKMKNEKKWSRY